MPTKPPFSLFERFGCKRAISGQNTAKAESASKELSSGVGRIFLPQKGSRVLPREVGLGGGGGRGWALWGCFPTSFKATLDGAVGSPGWRWMWRLAANPGRCVTPTSAILRPYKRIPCSAFSPSRFSPGRSPLSPAKHTTRKHLKAQPTALKAPPPSRQPPSPPRRPQPDAKRPPPARHPPQPGPQ